jgi:hypothetical protein
MGGELYHILEDKSRDDFTIMLEKFELDGWRPLWETYQVYVLPSEGSGSVFTQVIYHIILKKDEEIASHGLLGKKKGK